MQTADTYVRARIDSATKKRAANPTFALWLGFGAEKIFKWPWR